VRTANDAPQDNNQRRSDIRRDRRDKARVREYVRCRNNSHVARDQAGEKHGRALKGKALLIAAAEGTKLEHDQFPPVPSAWRPCD
jgi:hypothetical protein